MFYRIVMYIVAMPLQIVFIAYDMFPEATLPHPARPEAVSIG